MDERRPIVNPYEVVVSAYENVDERSPRLHRVVGAIALLDELLAGNNGATIVGLHDAKGTLHVTWTATPSDYGRQIVARCWGSWAANELAMNVEHEVNGEPV